MMTGYLLILPFVLFMLVTNTGPLVYGIIKSFFSWSLVGESHFVGFDVYRSVFANDIFWKQITFSDHETSTHSRICRTSGQRSHKKVLSKNEQWMFRTQTSLIELLCPCLYVQFFVNVQKWSVLDTLLKSFQANKPKK